MAVVLVVLFHLRVPGFEAGFLGVDIFFVLSGFLITSLVLDEIDRIGRMSLSAFWARRIRRSIATSSYFNATGIEYRSSTRGHSRSRSSSIWPGPWS